MAALTSFLWLLSAVALLVLSMRTSAMPVAAWLSLTLLLRGARAAGPGGVVYAVVALYAGMAVGMRGVIPIAGPPFYAVAGVIALSLAMPLVADRLVGPRIAGAWSTLVFPMAWVAIEFAQARVGGYGTNGSIAYTQSGNLPLVQLAAVTGIWGITFLIAWFASIVNWSWERQFDLTRIGPGAAVYAGVLVLALLAGSLRLAFAATTGRTIRAAAISFPVGLFEPGELTRIYEGRVDDTSGAEAARLSALQNWFLEASMREAKAGARLVAWPEVNLILLKADEAAFVERATHVARAEQIYLAMGIASIERGAHPSAENKLVLIEPSGRTAFSYLKSRPVPGWEAGVIRVGDGRLPIVDTADARVAAAICFENDFPESVSAFGRAHAELWLAPSNDWEAVKRSHFAMMAFRAIENGTPVFRPTSSGVSGAFDAYGRVLAFTDHFSGARTMTAAIPLGAVATLYPRIGDSFAWLCVSGLVAASIVALFA